MRRATLELLATVNPSYQGPMEKADGFSVDSMVHFRPDLFGAGDAVLPLSKLKPAGFDGQAREPLSLEQGDGHEEGVHWPRLFL
jgi:hypothetical protein